MIHHLRAAGVSVVLDVRGTRVPRILHWGADLGPLDDADLAAFADARVPAVAPSSIDRPFDLSVFPRVTEGWTGRPPIVVRGSGPCPSLREAHAVGRHRIDTSVEWGAALIRTRWELTSSGILRVCSDVENVGDDDILLSDAGVVLPLPDRAREVLDFSGRWSGERMPQRHRPPQGVWLRETRHGRGGHDDPYLMIAGTPGFGFTHGEVWAVHLAFSGDTRLWFERSDLGATVLGAGERLGELRLAPTERYAAPAVFAFWSDEGLDAVAARSHAWVRETAPATRPRPLTLNTWEAVYFDHDLSRLSDLARSAGEVGVERFVLDDGWFRGRSDDTRALGDWVVDERAWPDGLTPLIDRVREAGMEFGLWMEPEMVSLDSDLARAHPDWLLSDRDGPTWRSQHVLDLTRIEVRDHLFAAIDALLREYPIAFVKWDHNRDLLVDDSGPQTRALYALVDDLRRAHPHVEIESCASGGARIDLEMVRHVDRFWTSDTNDPAERQRIQQWTGLLLPPEYLGAHVGDARAHTTGRVSSLSFRLATALFLHAGIESDLTRLSGEERAALSRWAAYYRANRGFLHSGRAVHADLPGDGAILHGVVGPDRRRGLYSYAALGRGDAALPPHLALPGLDPDVRYRVETVDFGAPAAVIQDAPPPWIAAGVELPGRVLAEGALAVPLLAPGNALLFDVRAQGVAETA